MFLLFLMILMFVCSYLFVYVFFFWGRGLYEYVCLCIQYKLVQRLIFVYYCCVCCCPEHNLFQSGLCSESSRSWIAVILCCKAFGVSHSLKRKIFTYNSIYSNILYISVYFLFCKKLRVFQTKYKMAGTTSFYRFQSEVLKTTKYIEMSNTGIRFCNF